MQWSACAEAERTSGSRRVSARANEGEARREEGRALRSYASAAHVWKVLGRPGRFFVTNAFSRTLYRSLAWRSLTYSQKITGTSSAANSPSSGAVAQLPAVDHA